MVYKFKSCWCHSLQRAVMQLHQCNYFPLGLLVRQAINTFRDRYLSQVSFQRGHRIQITSVRAIIVSKGDFEHSQQKSNHRYRWMIFFALFFKQYQPQFSSFKNYKNITVSQQNGYQFRLHVQKYTSFNFDWDRHHHPYFCLDPVDTIMCYKEDSCTRITKMLLVIFLRMGCLPRRLWSNLGSHTVKGSG